MPLHRVPTGKGREHRRDRCSGGESFGAVAPTSLRVGPDHLGGAVRVHCGGRGRPEKEDPDCFRDSRILQRECPLPADLAATEQYSKHERFSHYSHTDKLLIKGLKSNVMTKILQIFT